MNSKSTKHAAAIAAATLVAGFVGASVASFAKTEKLAPAKFQVRHDTEVTKSEPPPHNGVGQSTAYRYFDHLTDAKVIFRKRALHKGAAIGMHVLTHDEVYYVVSGQGELTVGEKKQTVGPNTAIYMYEGEDVGIRQQGDADLVIIISYPPAKT